MRFFPRDAFKNPPETPAEVPFPLAPFQPYQQQTWPQTSMPVTALQGSFMDPMVVQRLQLLASLQTVSMHMALRSCPRAVFTPFPNPLWPIMGFGGFDGSNMIG